MRATHSFSPDTRSCVSSAELKFSWSTSKPTLGFAVARSEPRSTGAAAAGAPIAGAESNTWIFSPSAIAMCPLPLAAMSWRAITPVPRSVRSSRWCATSDFTLTSNEPARTVVHGWTSELLTLAAFDVEKSSSSSAGASRGAAFCN